MYGSGSLILYKVFILTYPMFTGFITVIYDIRMKVIYFAEAQIFLLAKCP